MNAKKNHNLILELAAACMILAFMLNIMKSALFLGKTTLTHDSLYWYLPFFHFFAEGIARGELYMWNPFSHGGEPTITAYLQLRLLDPISVLTVLVGKLFTQDTIILFGWDRFLRAFIGSVGAYILLRRLTDQVLVRISLQAVLLLTPFLTNGLHQNGITDQFYAAPYFLIFFLRLTHGRDYRIHNWIGLALTFGISFQSYFFVGTFIFGLFALIGFLLFRRDELLDLVRHRPNRARALVAVVLLMIMSWPMAAYYMDRSEYVYPVRALDEKSVAQGGKKHAQGGSFNIIDAHMIDSNGDQSLMMPYETIWITGTFSRLSDVLGLIAPVASGAISQHLKYSEAPLYVGLLVFLCALYGMLFASHELKRVWIVITSLFALLILGPYGLLHHGLYYVFPPLWLVRHTHQFVGFFILGLLFFYVLGADRVVRHLLAPGHNAIAPFQWATKKNAILLLMWVSIGAVLVLGSYVYEMGSFRKALMLVYVIFVIFLVSNLFMKSGDDSALSRIISITIAGTVLIAVLGNEAVRYDSDVVGKVPAPPFIIAGIVVFTVFLRRWAGTAAVFIAMMAALLLIAYANSERPGVLTGWVMAFMGFPLILYFISRHLGNIGRKWVAHVLVLCVLFELALAFSVVGDWKDTRPEHCLDISATNNVAGDTVPVRRLTTQVSCEISPYNQPVRYMELLSRQHVALGLPAQYPLDGDFSVGNERFGDVMSAGVWNTFSYLQGYSKLIKQWLPEPVLEEVFTIDRPIIQFREHMYIVDDFISTISAMPPSKAVDMLRRGIFVESGIQDEIGRLSVEKSSNMDAVFKRSVSYGYNNMVIDTDSNIAGYIYFADGYDKYWKARIDGAEVPVMRANVNFKAIALPSGKHRVVIEYSPTTQRWAILVFELTFLLGIAYVAICEWRGRTADVTN